jgi:hypothetical protein
MSEETTLQAALDDLVTANRNFASEGARGWDVAELTQRLLMAKQGLRDRLWGAPIRRR